MYVFVGLGRAPGHMGCYVGNKYAGAGGLRKCSANPLFGADLGYGPVESLGAEANLYFEFRTVSSADVVRLGDHYYMVYEGVRGPSDPTVVDNQFALGLARSAGLAIDGPWEKYAGNPIIIALCPISGTFVEICFSAPGYTIAIPSIKCDICYSFCTC